MALLLAKAGALGCHFKAFPAINQRLSSPPARAPTACATNDPPQKQNNGAIMMPQFGHWLHLHLCIYIYSRSHAQVQLLYLMCSSRGGGGGKLAHIDIMQEYLHLGWGRGSTWLRLHTTGHFFPSRGFFMSAPVWCRVTSSNLSLINQPKGEPQGSRLTSSSFSSPPPQLTPASWISATGLED